MSMIVTIRAILKYCNDARQAQSLLDEANNAMKQAAEELCSVSSGDWAVAFMEEQNKTESWVQKMISIGAEYIETLQKVATKYEEAERSIQQRIGL